MVAYIPSTLMYVFIGVSLNDIFKAASNQGLIASNPAAFSFIACTLLACLIIIIYTILKVYQHFENIAFVLESDQDDDKSMKSALLNERIQALAGNGLLEDPETGRATI